jgi:hypothetical protein
MELVEHGRLFGKNLTINFYFLLLQRIINHFAFAGRKNLIACQQNLQTLENLARLEIPIEKFLKAVLVLSNIP